MRKRLLYGFIRLSGSPTRKLTTFLIVVGYCFLHLVAPGTHVRGVSKAHSTSTTFLVTSVEDAGPGTLRQAILDANASPGLDAIAFSVGSGPCSIRITRDLPEIVDPFVLDGRTQPGYQGRPIVELTASVDSFAGSGLFLSASGSTVAGLVVNGFANGSGLRLDNVAGARIVNNFIGTSLDGSEARPNNTGLSLHNCSGVMVGGTLPADRNVLSGNEDVGLRIWYGPDGMSGNVVQGNFIGLDVDGSAALGNGRTGIEIFESIGTRIGGSEPGAGNVISANGGDAYGGGGVQISGGFDFQALESTQTIEGNRIGTDVTGLLPLGNRGSGLALDDTGPLVIGGAGSDVGNIIAFNGGAGISTNNRGVKVYGNSIFENRLGGIDLPALLGVPRPTIRFVEASGGQLHIRAGIDFQSSQADPPILVQFYTNDACSESDAHAANGQRYLGAIEVFTADNGLTVFDAMFPGTLSSTGGVTATATISRHRATSAFSACVPDTGGCARPFVIERPTAVDVNAGESATFSVAVDASAPVSYQWFEVRSGAAHSIEGATSSTFESPQLFAGANYRVTVSNLCGSVFEDTSATVCSGPPIIRTQPFDRFPGRNEGVGLLVELVTPANYSFQWYRGERGDTSDPISHGKGSFFSIAVSERTSFWVRVTNACGSVDSATATITPGPFVDKVKYSVDASGESRLTFKGTGFSDRVYVTINGIPFLEPAVVKNNRVAVQKGNLQNNRTIRQSLPRNSQVLITLRNELGTSVAVVNFSRQ